MYYSLLLYLLFFNFNLYYTYFILDCTPFAVLLTMISRPFLPWNQITERNWQSSVLPLAVGRGLCRGWCTRWCPRGAGPGDGCLRFPYVGCPPFPEETNRGPRTWRWTTRGWTLPPQSLCTCRPHQNSFPVATDERKFRWMSYLISCIDSFLLVIIIQNLALILTIKLNY